MVKIGIGQPKKRNGNNNEQSCLQEISLSHFFYKPKYGIGAENHQERQYGKPVSVGYEKHYYCSYIT
jgi:hypothetical protein